MYCGGGAPEGCVNTPVCGGGGMFCVGDTAGAEVVVAVVVVVVEVDGAFLLLLHAVSTPAVMIATTAAAAAIRLAVIPGLIQLFLSFTDSLGRGQNPPKKMARSAQGIPRFAVARAISPFCA